MEPNWLTHGASFFTQDAEPQPSSRITSAIRTPCSNSAAHDSCSNCHSLFVIPSKGRIARVKWEVQCQAVANVLQSRRWLSHVIPTKERFTGPHWELHADSAANGLCARSYSSCLTPSKGWITSGYKAAVYGLRYGSTNVVPRKDCLPVQECYFVAAAWNLCFRQHTILCRYAHRYGHEPIWVSKQQHGLLCLKSEWDFGVLSVRRNKHDGNFRDRASSGSFAIATHGNSSGTCFRRTGFGATKVDSAGGSGTSVWTPWVGSGQAQSGCRPRS